MKSLRDQFYTICVAVTLFIFVTFAARNAATWLNPISLFDSASNGSVHAQSVVPTATPCLFVDVKGPNGVLALVCLARPEDQNP